jgi:hypothetical protein
MNKNIGELGLLIPVVSPIQILHDLADCITTTNTKIAKRLARLKVTCKCMGIDYEKYVSHLVVQKENITNISPELLSEYLLFPASEFSSNIDRVILGDGRRDESIKKTIEAILTASINSDTLLYADTCVLSNVFVQRVIQHSIFGPLFDDKRIIFVYKGGIAQRLSLLASFPEYSSEIKEAFGYGGDNDCTFIVDPQLPNYTYVRTLLVDFVYHCMLEYATRFSKGIVKEKSESITSIEIPGIPPIPVEAINRENFRLYKEQGNNVLEIDTFTEKDVVYTTSNDTLKFNDEIGRICSFTLLRYKKAFKVGNRIIGAELLDVSIPHRDESKASENYHHYYSGQWIKYINI